jgi:hypothetical protein
MLMTPVKFDWAKGFLSSQLWNIIKEPIESKKTIYFVILDKCVVNQAPVCKLIEEAHEVANNNTMPDEIVPLSPKRKSREGKVPLVESEVRRSPRLTILNDGYKNHDNCVDKNCLVSNAAPPLIHNKVVKNLAASFCKVEEDPGPVTDNVTAVNKAKKGKAQTSANGINKDKGTSAGGGVAPQAKKRLAK